MGILGDVGTKIHDFFAGPDVESPTAPTYDWSQANYDRGQQQLARNQQQELAKMLMEQAAGRGPSVAQQQLRQAQAANMAQQTAGAASAQGGAMNRALAQTSAANINSGLAQQTAGQAAELRAQEQLGAMGQASGAVGAMRGQDISEGTLAQNRQLGVATNVVATNEQGVEAQKANQAAQQKEAGAILGAGMGVAALGTIGGSDKRIKHDIEPASHEEMSALMQSLMPKKFRYDGEGQRGPIRVGIIANEVEKNPLGRQMVGRDEHGIREIEGGPALMAVLAAIGDLYSRLPKENRHG